jgi:hypothetical protein
MTGFDGESGTGVLFVAKFVTQGARASALNQWDIVTAGKAVDAFVGSGSSETLK